MSLQSGVPLRDGAKSNEEESHLPSVERLDKGRNSAFSGGLVPRKTTEQLRLLKPGRSLIPKAPANLLARRFLKHVRTTDGNGCREWQGTVSEDGYGRFMHRGSYRLAHRIAWELFRGPIPEGLEIDHTCFNRRCVAVEHLEPVTGAENTRRAHAAGRMNVPHDRTIGVVQLAVLDAPITGRQIEVLRIIASHVVCRGVPPSIREIGNELRIRSTNGVNDHLKTLERKGLIERDQMKSRSIQITARGMKALGLSVDQHRCLTCGQSLPPSPTEAR